MDFWSGNARSVLTSHGWACRPYTGVAGISKGEIILWEQDGHACICSVSGLLCLDCSDDYDGVQGDSTGREISEKTLYGEWTGGSGRVYRADWVLTPPYCEAAIDAGIFYGRQIAENPLWGYSMERRWDAYYRDCTSFCADIANHMEEYSGGSETPSETGLQPRYCILGSHWYPELIGLRDTCGSGDDYAGVMGVPMIGFACNCGRYRSAWAGGWLPWVQGYDTSDYYNGYAGRNGEALTGLEIEDASVHYQLHILGGDWLADRECGGSQVVDAVRMWRD